MERAPYVHAHLCKVKTTLNSFGLGTMAELSTLWFKTKSVAHMQSSELHKSASPFVSSLYLESSPTLIRFQAKFRLHQTQIVGSPLLLLNWIMTRTSSNTLSGLSHKLTDRDIVIHTDSMTLNRGTPSFIGI